MTLSDAITARTSLRSYLRVPISAEQRLELGKTIDQSNQRPGFTSSSSAISRSPLPL